MSGRKDLVDHYLVHCPQSNDKLLYLLALLRLNLVDRKVIVFVNTVDAGFRVKVRRPTLCLGGSGDASG